MCNQIVAVYFIRSGGRPWGRHIGGAGSQGEAHADLVGALADEVGYDAVDADGRQQHRHAGEDAEEAHVETRSVDGLGEDFHRHDVGDGSFGVESGYGVFYGRGERGLAAG